MSATTNQVANQQYPKDTLKSIPKRKGKILNIPSHLPNPIATHHPKSGINSLVDAACRLFSILGKLNTIKNYSLEKQQKELINEIRLFLDIITQNGYDAECIFISQYVLCVSFDEMLANAPWITQGEWDNFNLLHFFNLKTHPDLFFIILERATQTPSQYIDVMELMYICLSMGYKGQYRNSPESQFQLEQITHGLYKHIRAYRGNFSKTLSPPALNAFKSPPRLKRSYCLSIFLAATCIIMIIFVSLDFLTDIISNEAYKNIASLQKPTPSLFIKQSY